MSVEFWAVRDSLTAMRDEDQAMAHVTIIKGQPDEQVARKLLAEYMIGEAEYLIKNYGPDAQFKVNRLTSASAGLLARAGQMVVVAAQVISAVDNFSNEKNWEAINFDVDNIRFQLIRVERKEQEVV